MQNQAPNSVGSAASARPGGLNGTGFPGGILRLAPAPRQPPCLTLVRPVAARGGAALYGGGGGGAWHRTACVRLEPPDNAATDPGLRVDHGPGPGGG